MCTRVCAQMYVCAQMCMIKRVPENQRRQRRLVAVSSRSRPAYWRSRRDVASGETRRRGRTRLRPARTCLLKKK